MTLMRRMVRMRIMSSIKTMMWRKVIQKMMIGWKGMVRSKTVMRGRMMMGRSRITWGVRL